VFLLRDASALSDERQSVDAISGIPLRDFSALSEKKQSVDTLQTPVKDKPSNRSKPDLLSLSHKSTPVKSRATAMPNSADPTTFIN